MSDNRISENQSNVDPQYLKERELEAAQVDRDNKKYICCIHIDVQPHTPDEYYGTLKDWREMPPFEEPKKKYANQDAGISIGLRIKAFFNKEAKAELKTKKKQADAIHESDVKVALDRYNKNSKLFYARRSKQHDDVNKLHTSMKEGNATQIIAYFSYALQQDDYSTDFINKFDVKVDDVQHDQEKRKLCFAYRIPNKEEILTFSSFVYDVEADSIQPKPIDEKHQLVQRTQLLYRILLRALRMVYESDTYCQLDDVEIVGFLEYFDSAYGTERRKDVINFHMSRDEYEQTNFERVNVEELFSTRLKAKISDGLYTKEVGEIKDIYVAKGESVSKTKKR